MVLSARLRHFLLKLESIKNTFLRTWTNKWIWIGHLLLVVHEDALCILHHAFHFGVQYRLQCLSFFLPNAALLPQRLNFPSGGTIEWRGASAWLAWAYGAFCLYLSNRYNIVSRGPAWALTLHLLRNSLSLRFSCLVLSITWFFSSNLASTSLRSCSCCCFKDATRSSSWFTMLG